MLVGLGEPNPNFYIINTDNIVTIVNYGEDVYRVWMVGGEFRQISQQQYHHLVACMGGVRWS